MSKIKAILFDLDNTLIDFVRMKTEAIKAASKAMIKSGLKTEEVGAYRRLITIYRKGMMESDNAFQEFLKSESGKIDEKMLAAAINAYLKTKDSFMKPYPNVKPVLRQLKKRGIKLGIITDAPKLKAYQRLLGMNIEKYFDFVICFEDTGKKKKTELPLKSCIEKLGLKAEEIMMVGDSIRKDVLPARKLGVIGVLAKYGSSDKAYKIKPDFELNDFRDILKIIY